MSVFVDDDTRVVVQGITGGEGKFHTEQMLDYGTNVVAGAVPGKGGQAVAGVPVYDTVAEAVDAEDANASVVFVPPAFAGDAIFEALDTDLDLVVAITEGIPTQDMAKVNKRLSGVDTTLIGPNCPGIITPGEAKLGILPGNIFEAGNVGLVSRSGTLTYQVVSNLTDRGIGQTTAIGIGGDPIIGTSFHAGGGVHRRPHRAAGQAHGPRRGNRLGVRHRDCRVEDQRAQRCWRSGWRYAKRGCRGYRGVSVGRLEFV